MKFKKVSDAPEEAKNALFISCNYPETINLESVNTTKSVLVNGKCGLCDDDITWSTTAPDEPMKICSACTIMTQVPHVNSFIQIMSLLGKKDLLYQILKDFVAKSKDLPEWRDLVSEFKKQRDKAA